MTTRACDFSSFKRPPRPPATPQNESPQSTTGRMNSSSTPTQFNSFGTEGFSTTPRNAVTANPRKYMSSHSVDPSSSGQNPRGYMGGSMSGFQEVNSPSMSSFSPAPVTTFSAQNLDKYSTYDRRPSNISHSTIDRATLPYDSRQKNSDGALDRDTSNRQDEKGSGLVFVDGGRRGVMSADSQHSLNGSLNGHRIDRSLVNRQNSNANSMKDSFDGGYDPGYDTHPRNPYNVEVVSPASDIVNRYNNARYHPSGQYAYQDEGAMDGSQCAYGVTSAENDVYPTPYNNIAGTMPSQIEYHSNMRGGRNDNIIRPRGSPHNVSSGESGIAGCDFNTLGAISYDAYAAAGAESVSPSGRYTNVGGRLASSSSAVAHAASQSGNQITDPRSQQVHYNTGSQASNGESNRSSHTAESSLTGRGECNQQTLLLPTGSGIHLNASGDENSVTIYDQNAAFRFPSSYSQQRSSVPKISTKPPSRASYSKALNPFKMGKKRSSKNKTDQIYQQNNLYGPKDKKTSKYDSEVVLGTRGATSTGISFNSPYGSMKRPFCPRWTCIVLALFIGIVIALSIGLVIYLYVWPSVLQPLVESSKPVDGQWGSWRPWFECSATCGQGTQNRTRECNSPSPEDGGEECEGPKYNMRTCNAPVECPDCARVCMVGTLSGDCRSCTCEGHVITGRITDEFGNPLPGVKVYRGSGATLLLSGTDNDGKFRFEGVCSNGDNELRLEKEMYRISKTHPIQSETDPKAGFVSFAMTKLFLPTFTMTPKSEERLAGQKVVMCCEAESEQPPTKYVWYKDTSRLDPSVYHYSLHEPSLVLPELMVWDGGDYTCEVQNEAGFVKSDPATLTVYGNWTDLCNPTPVDKFVPLPGGCSEAFFNTKACVNDNAVTLSFESEEPTTTRSSADPQCIAGSQFPNDSPNDVCHRGDKKFMEITQYCCKPVEEEEVTLSCKLKELNTPYNMALKRVISCGCTLCE